MVTAKNTNSKNKSREAAKEKILTAEGWRRRTLKQARPTPKKQKNNK